MLQFGSEYFYLHVGEEMEEVEEEDSEPGGQANTGGSLKGKSHGLGSSDDDGEVGFFRSQFQTFIIPCSA